MKFSRNATRLLLITTFLVTVITMVLTIKLFGGLINSAEEKQFTLMKSIMVNALKGAEAKALARAEILISFPNVRDAFAKRDRELLLSETIDMFKLQQEKYGLAQAQFHLPPAISFLRLNAPKKYGDDLSGFRPIVVAVNKQQTEITGVTISRSGPGIVACIPVRDAGGKHIGSFEMGLDFGPLMDGIKNNFSFDSTLFIDEELLTTVATLLKGDVLNKQNRVGKYLKFYTTHSDLMSQLVQDIDLKSDMESMYIKKANNKPYGVLLLPIKNLSGKTIGMMATATDFSGSRADALQMRVWQLLLALFGIVLQYGMIKIVIKGELLKPLEELGRNFNALADGYSYKKIKGSERFCEEMQDIVESYEEIRLKKSLKK